MPQYKTGRLPAVRPAALAELEVYAAGKLPAPPASVQVPRCAYPMDRNDVEGDCIVEGTVVAAPHVQRGYRMRYSGPIVRIKFASGKVLAVTPNHAVLTPNGFVRAKFLKEGDDAVSARGGDLLAASDRDHAPAPIEQIQATLQRRASRSGAAVSPAMVEAIDFHGDGRFVDGDVDVVDAYGSLKHEAHSTFGKPSSEQALARTREATDSFHRRRSPFQRFDFRSTSALRRVGASGYLSAFDRGHSFAADGGRLRSAANRYSSLLDGAPHPRTVDAGLLRQGDVALALDIPLNKRHQGRLRAVASKPQGIAGCALPMASSSHPSVEGGTTDPDLFGDLRHRFPGLVSTDHIVHVNVEGFDGHVYDLSTEPRWYIANDIITHNCTIAGVDHLLRAWNAQYPLESVEPPTRAQIERTYRNLTGGPDTGLVEADVLKTWMTHGLFGTRIEGYAPIHPTNLLTIHQAIAFYGGAYLGIMCPRSAQEQFAAGEPWTYCGEETEDGHCVVALGYDAHGDLIVATWGGLAVLTAGFRAHYLQEAWCVLGPQVVAARRDTLGVDLVALQTDLSRV